MTRSSEIFDRAYGCLLGQAIGDALGTRYEFEPADVAKMSMETDLHRQRLHGKSSRENAVFLPILGNKQYKMEPGQITDDTEMAMALARSLQRKKEFDVADVAKSYAYWFFTSPPDLGGTTRNAFDGLPKYSDVINKWSAEKIHRNVLESSEEKNQQSLSNGCLMRISPLAIAGTNWHLDQLREAAVADCNITHPNPIAHDAVASYVTAIWYLIKTGDRQLAYQETMARVRTPRIRQLLEVDDDPTVPIVTKKGLIWINGDEPYMGYLGIALKWAFMELRKNDDNALWRALYSVISRGGDTDTNGCITGALIGAYIGASKIPEEWKLTVLEAKPRREKYDWAKMADAEELVEDLLKTKP